MCTLFIFIFNRAIAEDFHCMRAKDIVKYSISFYLSITLFVNSTHSLLTLLTFNQLKANIISWNTFLFEYEYYNKILPLHWLVYFLQPGKSDDKNPWWVCSITHCLVDLSEHHLPGNRAVPVQILPDFIWQNMRTGVWRECYDFV